MMPLSTIFHSSEFVFDHARIAEKLLQIAAHRFRLGRIRRAEIDQQHADAAMVGMASLLSRSASRRAAATELCGAPADRTSRRLAGAGRMRRTSDADAVRLDARRRDAAVRARGGAITSLSAEPVGARHS